MSKENIVIKSIPVGNNRMPDVRGMGLRDALYVLESCQVKVSAVGRGKVKQQSLAPGSPLRPDQQVWVMLN